MEGGKRSGGAVRSQRAVKPELQQSAPGFSVTKPGARNRQSATPAPESRGGIFTLMLIFGVLTLGLVLALRVLLSS